MCVLACRTTGYASLPLVMDNWTLALDAGDGSTVLGAAWESPHYDNISFCTRSKAFFTASATGFYTFWVTADDYARLRMTFMNVSEWRPCLVVQMAKP